ncbi:hypothetical protein, partial [Nitrobacter sp. Nb-311A]|uniref:hypothetical protein n=1 Tax=Nitrobacter sp. Nb-311A TaxID=314253 RepID=UPI001A9521DA
GKASAAADQDKASEAVRSLYFNGCCRTLTIVKKIARSRRDRMLLSYEQKGKPSCPISRP